MAVPGGPAGGRRAPGAGRQAAGGRANSTPTGVHPHPPKIAIPRCGGEGPGPRGPLRRPQGAMFHPVYWALWRHRPPPWVLCPYYQLTSMCFVDLCFFWPRVMQTGPTKTRVMPLWARPRLSLPGSAQSPFTPCTHACLHLSIRLEPCSPLSLSRCLPASL